jgi:hypothetical protein
MELKYSLPCSQKTDIGAYPEPQESRYYYYYYYTYKPYSWKLLTEAMKIWLGALMIHDSYDSRMYEFISVQ